MAIFDAAARAALAGRTVRGSLLVFFDFAGAPMRLHKGFGRLAAGGFEWRGIRGLGTISGVEMAVGGLAPVATFELSGVGDEIVQDVLLAPTVVKGREARVYLQFHDQDTLQPIGAPCTVYRGIMDRLVDKRPSVGVRRAVLSVETRYSSRGLARFGNLTDRDQQRRYPGDIGLFMVPAMQNRRRPWNPAKEE